MAEYLSVQTVTKQTTSWCLDKHNVSSILLSLVRKTVFQLGWRPTGTLQANWNITGLQKHYRLLEQCSQCSAFQMSTVYQSHWTARLRPSASFGELPPAKTALGMKERYWRTSRMQPAAGLSVVSRCILHASVRHCMPCHHGPAV